MKEGYKMKAMKLAILFLLVPLTSSYAQDIAIPTKKAEQFLSTLLQGEVDKAYDSLFQGSVIPERKPQAVDMLKRQTKMGLPVFGKGLGFELSNQQEFGKSIVRLVYIFKCELHPLIWEFYFYRPNSEWVLSNIRFNDEFGLLGEK